MEASTLGPHPGLLTAASMTYTAVLADLCRVCESLRQLLILAGRQRWYLDDACACRCGDKQHCQLHSFLLRQRVGLAGPDLIRNNATQAVA